MKLNQIYRTLELTIRFFTAKRVMTQASALTYSTLLAIVPMLAVIFAIARGFGYNKYIEIWFREALSSQPQVADILTDFVTPCLTWCDKKTKDAWDGYFKTKKDI